LLNWLYMTFVYTCPISLEETRREAAQKLRAHMGATTEDADMDAFLED
jgi:hypothetical protein